MKSTSAEDLAGIDLVLTSYAALLRLDWLGKTRWRLAVVDEAQAIKNPEVKQTRAVKSLDAESRIALTGTPIENDLRDLWSIFDLLNPGLLGSSKTFAGFVKSLAERTPPNYAPLRKLVATLHPAAAEDRQRRHHRSARQDGGQGILRAEPQAGVRIPSAPPGSRREPPWVLGAQNARRRGCSAWSCSRSGKPRCNTGGYPCICCPDR